MTSDEIATAIDTNPVVVRRLLASMQDAGLVTSQKGPRGGTRLAEPAKKISLAQIYKAIEKRPFLHVPYNSSGAKDANHKRVAASLKDAFRSVDQAIEKEMESVTLSQIAKRGKK